MTAVVILPSAFDHRHALLRHITARGDAVQKYSKRLSVAAAHAVLHGAYRRDDFSVLVSDATSGDSELWLFSSESALTDVRGVYSVPPRDVAIAVAVFGVGALFRGGIILIGPPACGKGSQCELLTSALSFVHVSTGDLLREHVAAQTPLGRTIGAAIADGQLISDDIIVDMTLQRVAAQDARQRGYILDGFPRTAKQADALIRSGEHVVAVVELAVDRAAVIDRCIGRRIDPVSGVIYHLRTMPPPDDAAVRARLIQRADDTAETVGKRYRTFLDEREHIRRRFGNVDTVDASKNFLDVFHQILDVLSKHPRRTDTTRKLSSNL